MGYQNSEAELKRAENYIVRANDIHKRGFYTKSDKKDANDYLSRAYDTLVHYGFNNIVWASRVEDPVTGRWVHQNKAWEKLDYANFPALHVWAKNPGKYSKIYADFPEVVKRGNELAALRNLYEATPLVEKPKSRTAIKREERAADAKTCQICGRPILAETGVIAHHGYQRPRHVPGLQTRSCYGARELPFEKSRDILGAYLGIQRNALGHMVERRSQIARDLVPLHFSYWTGKYNHRSERIDTDVSVTKDTFAAEIAAHKPLARWAHEMPVSFESLKEKALRCADNEIRAQKDYITMQQKRYDEWKAVL